MEHGAWSMEHRMEHGWVAGSTGQCTKSIMSTDTSVLARNLEAEAKGGPPIIEPPGRQKCQSKTC